MTHAGKAPSMHLGQCQFPSLDVSKKGPGQSNRLPGFCKGLWAWGQARSSHNGFLSQGSHPLGLSPESVPQRAGARNKVLEVLPTYIPLLVCWTNFPFLSLSLEP